MKCWLTRSGCWFVAYAQLERRPSSAWLALAPLDVVHAWPLTPEVVVSFLNKARPVAPADPNAPPADAEFTSRCPALAEYLSARSYPDGTQRQTSSLTVFVEDGCFKAVLNDRDQEQALFVSERRFSDLFEALEILLQSDDVPWRKNRSKGQFKSKGKA